jgi:hypothetical protein
MNPGQLKVHVYVNLASEIALDDMGIEGENVVLRSKTTPDLICL